MNEYEKSLYPTGTTEAEKETHCRVYSALYDALYIYDEKHDAYIIDGKLYRRNERGLFAEVK